MDMKKIEDESDFKYLFMALWRERILILSITLIASLLAGLFSILILTPVYDSKLDIIINMPENYKTKYGDYALPITTNQQYINLITSNYVLLNTISDMGSDADGVTIEKLRDSITVSEVGLVTSAVGIEQNSFVVKVSSNNPEKAKIFAETLYSNYNEFLNVMLTEVAVEYYYNDYLVQIEALEDTLTTNKELLKKNEELISKTKQTINQKEAMNEIGTKDLVVLENIINPNYTELENDIISIKQNISMTETSIKQYITYVEDLANKKVDIENYYKTGDYKETISNMFINSNSYIYLSSKPIAPTRKTSPSNAKNVIIGAIAGGIISVMIALIKEYWFKKEEISKQ